MTEESESQSEPLSAIQSVDVVGSVDWFLQSVVETITKTGVEIGVTLTVGGAVSGTLISGKTYFEALSDVIAAKSQAEGDIPSLLSRVWKQHTAIYEEPEGAPDSWEPPTVGYIHLKEARHFYSEKQPIPSNQGVLWRGKLSSIDGFSFGCLSHSTK